MGFGSTLDPEGGPVRRLACGDIAGIGGIGHQRGREGRLRMLSEAFEVRQGGQIWRRDALPASGSKDALRGPVVDRGHEVSKGGSLAFRLLLDLVSSEPRDDDHRAAAARTDPQDRVGGCGRCRRT